MSEADVTEEMESKSHQVIHDSLYCSLCNVHVSSEHNMNAHLRGRPHQIVLDKHRAAERSVYVKGFQRDTSHRDLVDFFGQFGQVKSVWLPGNHVYAIVEFADTATAEKLLHSQELFLKGKRLTVKPRSVRGRHGYKASREAVAEETPHKQTSQAKSSDLPEPLQVFDTAILAEISAAKSADEQLTLMSTHFKMPTSAVKAQFTICKVLLDELRIYFPDCLVVPFGAAISGHGTLTSDCDICVLSHPSLEQKALFSPSSYHPTGSEEAPQQEGFSLLLPSSPLRQDSVTTSGSEASSASASPTQLPQKAERSHTPFDIVASCVRKMSHCSKFYTIRHARCPIMRFMYEPLGVHCDLSVNNLLGPANTRLMQAYSKFDSRFSLLVPFVRLWVKYNGPPRSQLNNYTVSLMLIYSLQRCDPPVLPCLQNPGPWPKNMSWYSKLGFSSSPQSRFSVGPWECGFVPPESLQPSTNTQSPVELLVHFFNFYSDWKGKEVVAIHCPAHKTLSCVEAKELAVKPQELGYKVRPFRDLMPLIVQDPFEFDHNLCKSLNKANCEMFFGRIKMAARILSETKMILSLFEQNEYELAEMRLVSNTKKLIFTTKQVEGLLGRDQALLQLAKHVSQLKLTSVSVHRSLSRVVLKAVTNYLTDKFNFNCSQKQAEQKQASATFDLSKSVSSYDPPQESNTETGMDHTASCGTGMGMDLPASGGTGMGMDHTVSGGTGMGMDHTVSGDTGMGMDHTVSGDTGMGMDHTASGGTGMGMDLSTSGDKLPSKPLSEGELDRCSHHFTEMSSKETAENTESCGAASHRKRAHSNNDEIEGDLLTEETKRTKSSLDQTLTALDVLHQVQESCTSDVYECSAVTDTWTHRRQRQRHPEKTSDEGMETSELSESLPTPLPLLCVRLSVSLEEATNSLVIIDVEQLPPFNRNKFKNWFSLINKELRITD